MKRVLHVITTIELGGAEKQLLVLAKAQVKEGRFVEIIFLKGKRDLEKDFIKAGAEVFSEFSNISPLAQVIRIALHIKKKKIELVHAHLPRAELICAIVSIFSRSNYFYTRHNSEKFFPRAPGYISSNLSKVVSSRFTSGIAISLAVAKFLLDNKEIKEKQDLSVVHYGFYRSIDSVYEDQKISPYHNLKKITVGTISRLTFQKNLKVLIEAIAILKNSYDINLLILGDGPQKDILKKLISDLDLENNVLILPKTKEVDKFMESLDVFALSSIYEGFGLVLLEAMDKKVPIVASNNSAIPEVLGANYSFLFDCYSPREISEKIIQILSFDQRILFKQYKNRLDLFNADVMCTKISSIYEEHSRK